MPTNVTVNDLKINKLTEAQYDTAVQGGVIGENELSIITDLDDAIQVSSLPTAAAAEEGKIYQYIGTTDANYTNGYFYKCVGEGSPVVYSWTQVNVQPAPSGLPDQTGQSGKFLTTDGTDASWGDALQNTATGFASLTIMGTPTTQRQAINIGNNSITTGISGYAIGNGAKVYNDGSIAIGPSTVAGVKNSSHDAYYDMIAIGNSSEAKATGAIQIGYGSNSEAQTLKIGMGFVNGQLENYKLLNTDGTIPTDRFTTTPVAAGTYSATITVDGQGTVTRSWAAPVDPLPSQSGQSGKFLTTDGTDASWTNIPDPLPSQTGNAGKVLTTNGTTASWVDISTSPSTMPQLLAANWSSNTQTVNVTGVTANNVVMVSPSPVSATEYAQCGILCTAQAAGTLTFTCTSVPTNDLTVNVVCF